MKTALSAISRSGGRKRCGAASGITSPDLWRIIQRRCSSSTNSAAPLNTRVRMLTCCRKLSSRASLSEWLSASTSPTSRGSDSRWRFAMRRNRRASQFVKLLPIRSEEHTSELQSQSNLVCRLLLEKKKKKKEKHKKRKKRKDKKTQKQ